MPKKFKGENSKAVEARARKEARKQEELTKKQQALEDEYWRDDDKHVQRKQQRKEEKEKKRTTQLERKKEADKLLEEELSSIKSAKPAPAIKLTRAQIQAQQELQAAGAGAVPKERVHDEVPLEENVNLICDHEAARSVDEAIAHLSVKGEVLDKHPEKRAKAAYAAFEEKNLPILKAENPNMRLSQLKQMLRKDWMKSPENPMNQRFKAYNEK